MVFSVGVDFGVVWCWWVVLGVGVDVGVGVGVGVGLVVGVFSVVCGGQVFGAAGVP